MENKNNVVNDEDSLDIDNYIFPKLKPTGSIHIKQLPKKKVQFSEKASNHSIDNINNKNIISKIILFDPDPSRIINYVNKSSKTIKNDELNKINEINENDENKDDEIYNEEIKSDEEKCVQKPKLETGKTFTDRDQNALREDLGGLKVKEIKEIPRRSEVIQINEKKKKFFGFGDNFKKIKQTIKDKKKIIRNNLKDNIKNQKKKIINFINKKNKHSEKHLNKHYDIEIIINFEKPGIFEEIEKQWNFVKVLLDNNIIDSTSKSFIYL